MKLLTKSILPIAAILLLALMGQYMTAITDGAKKRART